MDMEFENVKDLVPLVEINTTAAREHVRLVERKIRHLKEKTRVVTSDFPFKWIPSLVLIHTVYNCAFWINAFPNRSDNFGFSPRKIVTQLSTDYKRDCKVEIGSYVEVSTDAVVTNDNTERMLSCVAFGAVGNRQGSVIPVSTPDVANAKTLYGPSVPGLKGWTTRRNVEGDAGRKALDTPGVLPVE